MSRLLLLTIVTFAAICIPAGALLAREADADKRPVLRVVFFTPSDVEPPDGVRERLKASVDYARDFYAKWMKHWGYECVNPIPVNVTPSGYPEILFVKGRHDEASGAYRQLGFQGEVVESACREYQIDPKGQVWWIFTYKGPQRRGFRGGGNAKRGGTSTAIFDSQAGGSLQLTDHLGSLTVPRNSKASIHELGHAIGLPHIGPVQSDELGNSLMGPVVKAYASRFPGEERVYLTKASAALIWKHPLFRGSMEGHDVVPNVKLVDVEFTHDRAAKTIVCEGKIVSDAKAHSVVVANEPVSLRSDYWRKCFAGNVADDGAFKVLIDEVEETDGLLRLVCCFDNGANVGSDSQLGVASGFVMRYSPGNDGIDFAEGWAARGAGSRGQRRPQRPGASRPNTGPRTLSGQTR